MQMEKYLIDCCSRAEGFNPSAAAIVAVKVLKNRGFSASSIKNAVNKCKGQLSFAFIKGVKSGLKKF